MRTIHPIRQIALILLLAGGPSSLPTLLAQTERPGSPNPFFHGSRGERSIALTFDACSPSTRVRYDTAVVQALIAARTPATFFLGGWWITRHPQAVRFLSSVPYFEIGNHGRSHRHMQGMSEDSLRAEIQQTEQALKRVTGKGSRWFRPPFGEWDSALVQMSGQMGLRTAMYDLPSGDPDTSISEERLVDYTVHAARNGSVIVMHVNGNGRHTAKALPAIIAGLKVRGFRFVTLSELAGRRTTE